MTHTVTQEPCPTPQTRPCIYNHECSSSSTCKAPSYGNLRNPQNKRTPHGWPTCLKKQPPRVDFRNNDICMINDEESDLYEEPQARNMRVLYKLKVSKDTTSKNMSLEEEYDDDNYKSKETAV